MTRKPIFRPQADQEVQSARQWYDDQRPGLGIQFADAIEEAVELVNLGPNLGLAGIAQMAVTGRNANLHLILLDMTVAVRRGGGEGARSVNRLS